MILSLPSLPHDDKQSNPCDFQQAIATQLPFNPLTYNDVYCDMIVLQYN